MTERRDAPISTASAARWWLLTAIPGLIISVVLVMLLRGYFEPGPPAAHVHDQPAGTETFDVRPQNHVPGTVNYAQVPPVGGDHAPIWATCGVYGEPIASELGVHSMEHGAVWVTFDAGALSNDEIADLQQLVQRNYEGPERYVLLSPFEGLPAPVVASAWGRQLLITDPSDERLQKFIGEFRGTVAPEPGLPCFNGGLGEPSDFALVIENP